MAPINREGRESSQGHFESAVCSLQGDDGRERAKELPTRRAGSCHCRQNITIFRIAVSPSLGWPVCPLGAERYRQHGSSSVVELFPSPVRGTRLMSGFASGAGRHPHGSPEAEVSLGMPKRCRSSRALRINYTDGIGDSRENACHGHARHMLSYASRHGTSIDPFRAFWELRGRGPVRRLRFLLV